MNEIKHTAVLLTCYNRRDKTLRCLERFFKAKKPKNFRFKFFLVDDGSTDGTSEAVKELFPEIIIIKGNGNLFWNQGMLLAWKKAFEVKEYDFYLWLNDDAYIDNNAIIEMLESYYEKYKETDIESIVVGSFRNKVNSDKFSYGIRHNYKKIIPNGKIQNGNMMNGNLVLISKEVFNTVGFLSHNYTHAMGDYDYGLRAIECGFDIITTKNYIGTCPLNEDVPIWSDPSYGFVKRFQNLNSPLGLNIKEYKIFRKRFWPENYITSISKIYLRCFFPSLYNFFNK